MNRKMELQKLDHASFDLLVIGGGITGVGIALDAQSRGLKTALIEMQDFSSGTSSRSTKLIHGGLRYLKQLDIGLVNEVGRERAVVHRLAPHLVHPDKMLLPLVKGGNYGYWLTYIGLSIYDFLAGVKSKDRRRMLNRKETKTEEPLLREDCLEGAGLYAEYRTDDSRLVVSVAKTAASKGAVLMNYVKALDFVYLNDRVAGMKVKDVLSGQEFLVKASCVVNATGPWVDELREKDGAVKGKHIFLSKGVHLVVPKERLPLHHTVYFDNEDGRMIFAVPRGRITYIGTTDTAYLGEKAEPEVTTEDVSYILKAVNHMFPEAELTDADIESSWAGLRPLIHQEGKSSSEMSRKDEIFISHSGLISIAGGKLTGYRKMSERVVDRVFKQLDKKQIPCRTDQIPLIGGEFENYEAVGSFAQQLIKEHPQLLPNLERAEYLVHTYGTASREIVELAQTRDSDPETALALAEAEFTVKNEMVLRAVDFFERRTGKIWFDVPSIQRTKSRVLDRLSELLKWSPERKKEEQGLLEAALARITRFRMG